MSDLCHSEKEKKKPPKNLPPMLTSLLDDDSEWYNIPVVVRQCLRLLAKGQIMLEHRDNDVRGHLSETRESLSEWTKYTSMLEGDMRERIVKLEDETERMDRSQSERIEKNQKQVALANKDLESLQLQLGSLEKSHRASRVEILDSLETHRLELNSEIDSRLKTFSTSLFSHSDSLHDAAVLKLEQISKELFDVKRGVERDFQSANGEMLTLHTRALHSIAAMKDSISVELCALSNRVSQDFQYAQEIERRSTALGETLSRMEFVLSPEYHSLPKSFNSFSKALSDDLGTLKMSIQHSEECTQLLSTKITDSVNGAVDALTQRMLRHNAENQSAVAEITTQLRELQQSCEHQGSQSARSIDRIQTFLNIAETIDCLDQRIGNATTKASETLSLSLNSTISHLESRLTSSLETSRASTEVSSSYRVDELRQELFSTIEVLRRESESTKCSVRNELQQCFNSQAELGNELARVRGTTVEQLQGELRDVRETLKQSDHGIETHKMETLDALANLRTEVLSEFSKYSVQQQSIVRNAAVELQASIDESINKHKNAVDELVSLSSQVRQIEGDVRDLHKTAHTANEAVASCHAELTTLVGNLEAEVKDCGRLTSLHRDEFGDEVSRLDEKYKSTLRQLAESLEETVEDSREAKRSIYSLAQQVKVVEDKLTSVVLKTVQGSHSKLEAALDVLKGEHDAIRTSHSAVQAELSVLLGQASLNSDGQMRLPRGNTSVMSDSDAEPDRSFLSETKRQVDGLVTTVSELEVMVRKATQQELQGLINFYTKEEIDERFEINWSTIVTMMGNKEDRGSVEARLARVKSEILTEALSTSRLQTEMLRGALEEKADITDMKAMFESRVSHASEGLD